MLGRSYDKESRAMTPKPKNPAAVALGRRGGRAGRGKAKARSGEQARAAALARWGRRYSATTPDGFTDAEHTAVDAFTNDIG